MLKELPPAVESRSTGESKKHLTGAKACYLRGDALRRECGEFPHVHNDVVLSKPFKSFRVLRLAG
jgi:hypothetical protein